MTTAVIKDYLIKQIYIEKNVVTYRSLSRHFGISVSQAKRELEHHHAKAAEDSQVCYATYMLSGEARVLPVAVATKQHTKSHLPPSSTQDTDVSMDVDMDPWAPTQSVHNDDEEEDLEADDDYEYVPVIKVSIVNERGLEDAREKYNRLNSIHVYALSPSPIIDAGLLCTNNETIRESDASLDAQGAQNVGKILVSPVTTHKTAAQKALDKEKGKLKGRSTAAPIAGPSRVRAAPPQDTKPAALTPTASQTKLATSTPQLSKEEKKPAVKQTGKINFQPKPKAEAAPKEVAKAPSKAAGFFSAKPTVKKAVPTAAAAARAPKEDDPMEVEEDGSAGDKPKRGIKRKSVAPGASDDETQSQATSPPISRPPSRASVVEAKVKKESVNVGIASSSSAKQRRNRVLLDSDEEEEEVAPKSRAISKRKQEAAEKARLAEEREARELMDLDDDAVERVSRKLAVPSRKRSALAMSDDDEDGEQEFKGLSDEEDENIIPAPKAKSQRRGAPTKKSVKQEDEDTEMQIDGEEEKEEEEIPKPQRKKREKKAPVPVGRNGLKKRKVQKTKVVTDAKGYTQTEDYSDWESVQEEEEEAADKPAPKGKGKTKAKASTSKSEEGDADGEASSAQPSRAPSRAGSVAASKPVEPEANPAPKTKVAPKKKVPAPSANVKGKQQSIANFFGAKPKK